MDTYEGTYRYIWTYLHIFIKKFLSPHIQVYTGVCIYIGVFMYTGVCVYIGRDIYGVYTGVYTSVYLHRHPNLQPYIYLSLDVTGRYIFMGEVFVYICIHMYV